MSISRAAIATYLDEQFSALAVAVGQNATPETGYKPDIDNALRALAVSESDLAAATVEDGTREAVFALAEYYAARRFWRQLSDRVNHTMGETKFDFSKQIDNAKSIMDDAAARCVALGYNVVASGWSIGYLNQDWLEPEITTP